MFSHLVVVFCTIYFLVSKSVKTENVTKTKKIKLKKYSLAELQLRYILVQSADSYTY